jgi:uncharacterized membrane protein
MARRYAMVRRYAQFLGVVLLGSGLLGLLLGDGSFLGGIEIFFVENVVHIVLGALLLYAASARTSRHSRRAIVVAVGVVAIIIGLLGFTEANGTVIALPQPWGLAHTLLHLSVGALSVAVAWLLARDETVLSAARRGAAGQPNR